MEVLTWRAIVIDWRQGLKSPLIQKSILKLAFQQAQACYERCNEKRVMVDLPRQRIDEGDLATLTLRGDSEWLLVILKEIFGDNKKYEVSFLETLILPLFDQEQRNGGQISWGMSAWVAIFSKMWRVDFDQPYLPIGGESRDVLLIN